MYIVGMVAANHKNCTTIDCSDLCNFHGMWVNTTADSDGQHGYCVCDDMHYTLLSDIPSDENQGVGHHVDVEQYYCIHRRKLQLTAFTLHVNIFAAMFGAAHWYLGHVGLAVGQMLLGILGGFISPIMVVIGHVTKSNYNHSITCLSLAFTIWWLCDLAFFIKNDHYKDVHGQALYPW
jgi:hypothetical protein